MDKIVKIITSNIDTKSIDESEHSFIGVASAEVIDRDNEVVVVDGLDISEYMRNPVLTFQHQYNEFPIGRTLWLKSTNNGGVKKLIGKFQLHLKTEESKTVWELIKDGYLRTLSIMFTPLTYEDSPDGIRFWKTAKLLEIAVVTIPANPEAFIESVSEKNSALGEKVAKSIYGIKGAVATHSIPFLDDDVAWDGAKAREQLRKWASSDGSGDPDTIDWSKYKQGFAWYDEDSPETLRSYKLPHHYVVNGELRTCWRGVVSAMASLLGARGGVEIPEKDIEAVYKHLAKHYKDHGSEPPDLKQWTPEEAEAYLMEKLYFEPLLKGLKEINKVKTFLLDVIPTLKATPEMSDTDKSVGDIRERVEKPKTFKIKIKKEEQK